MATQDYAPPDLAEAGTIITAQGRIQIRHSQIIEIVGWGMIILGLWWLSTPLEPWINDLRQIVIPLLVACAIAWVLGHPFGVRVIVLATRLARHYRAWRRKQLILYSPARSADSHYSAKLKLPARALPPSTMPRETAQPPTHQPVTGSPVPTIFNPAMPHETARNQ